MCDKKEIHIIGTAGQLTTIRSIPVKRVCYGIAYYLDLLYVICQYPSSLLVFDMQGVVHRDVALQAAMKETFEYPVHIVVSVDGQHLYISDWGSNIVASITLQGKVTGVYKNDEMKKPRGMLVMQDGSLLVCGLVSGTIHHIFSGIKKGQLFTRNVPNAKSICYNHDSHRIFVGSHKCNQMKVFTDSNINCICFIRSSGCPSVHHET